MPNTTLLIYEVMAQFVTFMTAVTIALIESSIKMQTLI